MSNLSQINKDFISMPTVATSPSRGDIQSSGSGIRNLAPIPVRSPVQSPMRSPAPLEAGTFGLDMGNFGRFLTLMDSLTQDQLALFRSLSGASAPSPQPTPQPLPMLVAQPALVVRSVSPLVVRPVPQPVEQSAIQSVVRVKPTSYAQAAKNLEDEEEDVDEDAVSDEEEDDDEDAVSDEEEEAVFVAEDDSEKYTLAYVTSSHDVPEIEDTIYGYRSSNEIATPAYPISKKDENGDFQECGTLITAVKNSTMDLFRENGLDGRDRQYDFKIVKFNLDDKAYPVQEKHERYAYYFRIPKVFNMSNQTDRHNVVAQIKKLLNHCCDLGFLPKQVAPHSSFRIYTTKDDTKPGVYWDSVIVSLQKEAYETQEGKDNCARVRKLLQYACYTDQEGFTADERNTPYYVRPAWCKGTALAKAINSKKPAVKTQKLPPPPTKLPFTKKLPSTKKPAVKTSINEDELMAIISKAKSATAKPAVTKRRQLGSNPRKK